VLIGVKKKGTTEYLWSWHLWLTNYNPNAAPLSWQEDVYSYAVPGGAVHRHPGAEWATAAYTNKFIMDRNFGAASATRTDGLAKTRGLYYQFGRKDPFPAASVSLYDVRGAILPRNDYAPNTDCIVRVPGQTAIKTAEQHPYNFYYPGFGNWMQGEPYSNNAWSNPGWYTSVPKAGKSLFDPCPPGWRLPVLNVWKVPFASVDDFKHADDLAGWEFYLSGSSGATVFYPAAGSRLPDTGGMSSERGNGYIWTSTPYGGGGGRFFYFSQGTVDYQSGGERSYGFSVRCIQE
jgi:uncharacterized protein (TIGR02145 family)